MSSARFTHTPELGTVLALNVSGSGVTFSLESLPHLLGEGEYRTLKRALVAALDFTPREVGETEGQYIARLIRLAASVKYEKVA